MASSLMDVEDLLGLPERIEEQLENVPACCLAFNRWGTLLAAGCVGGAVALFDYQTRGLASVLEGGHGGSDVTALLWTSDGRTLLSGGRDGSLVAWDVASGQLRQHLLPPSTGAIMHLAWAHDGNGGNGRQQQEGQEDEVLVSRSASAALLLRLADGWQQELPMVCVEGSGGSSSDAASPSGQVAVVSHDGAIIYAGTRGAILVLRRSDVALLDVIRVGDGGTRILGLQLNPSGRRLLVTTADPHIRVFLLHRPGARQPLRQQQRLAYAAVVSSTHAQQASIAAPAGSEPSQAPANAPGNWQTHDVHEAWLAAAPASGLPRARNSIFHGRDEEWMSLLLDYQMPSSGRKQWKCAAFSPDGEYFASAYDAPGHEVYLWEAEAEARVNAVLEGQGSRESVQALCWHPRAAPMQLLVATNRSVYIWAKAFAENWSAFAPDFTELISNHEYVEPEDEFDNNPRSQDSQQQQSEGSIIDEEAEAEEVDIGTPEAPEQQVAAQLGSSPHAPQQLLHLPLRLNETPSLSRLGPAGATAAQLPQQNGIAGHAAAAMVQ